MKIVTNNQPRELLTWHDLPNDAQSDYDWDGADECSYFKYRDNYYCLANFMRVNSDELSDWDGAAHDTWFSGVLVKFTDCGDGVIVGRYCS